jgi:hypothetical protein
MADYVLNIDEILVDAAAVLANAFAKAGVAEAEIDLRIAIIEEEVEKKFIDWVGDQSELVANAMGSEAPSRSGNLASSFYTSRVGNSFTQNSDVSYASIVKDGRRGFGPKTKKFLVFRESRNGWRPANPAYVSGGAGNYPNFNITRNKYRLPNVKAAPAIDFPKAGFDRWEATELPEQFNLLKLEVANIILANGGEITSIS